MKAYLLIYTHIDDDGSGTRYTTKVKSTCFRARFKASNRSRHTEGLLYNETVCG